jgi:P-type Ca2+ transporter type 2C
MALAPPPSPALVVNLITDGLPALALATDPIDPDVLTRPPRRPDAQLVDWAFFSASSLPILEKGE